MLAYSILFALQYIISIAIAKKEKASIQKVDLPGIACDVCTLSIENLYGELKELREAAPYNKITELQVQEMLENICKTDDKIGEWIRYIDITTIEKNDGKSYAKIEIPGGVSKCESECLTVASSCESLYNTEIDQDDLSDILWKNKHSLERLTVNT